MEICQTTDFTSRYNRAGILQSTSAVGVRFVQGASAHMEYTDLTLAQDKGVLTITVDRPEVLNAQSRIMWEIIFRPAMSLVAPRR